MKNSCSLCFFKSVSRHIIKLMFKAINVNQKRTQRSDWSKLPDDEKQRPVTKFRLLQTKLRNITRCSPIANLSGGHLEIRKYYLFICGEK